MFQQLRILILPVRTNSTADCLGGGASACLYIAGSNEINRWLSERGCVSLHFFKPVETRLNGDCLRGVRQLALVLPVETRLTDDCLKGSASSCVCRRTRITPDSSILKILKNKIKNLKLCCKSVTLTSKNC